MLLRDSLNISLLLISPLLVSILIFDWLFKTVKSPLNDWFFNNPSVIPVIVYGTIVSFSTFCVTKLTTKDWPSVITDFVEVK